ncbi:MAG: MarR family winged helix-turn-helix transcriptional regulator [Calditrichia bacterium]
MSDRNDSKHFGTFMDRTLKQIRLVFSKTFKEHNVNITTEQWVLLHSLYQNNGQSQKELADESFKDPPTVSRIVDLLCDKGLTERSRFAGDRRRYKVFLTDSGREVVDKIAPAIFALRSNGWDGLSDKDYDTFLRILNQLYKNFQNM